MFKLFKQLKYKLPSLFILGIFLAVNFLLMLVFSLIIALIEGQTYGDSLVYVLTIACMPDKLFEISNGSSHLWEKSHFVQIVFMVIEMVLFSGAIIGFITNFFSNMFERNKSAKGKIALKNHIVILNWSRIGAELVYNLSLTGQKLELLILSDTDRESVLNSIHSIFVSNGKKNRSLNIIVKEGTTYSSKELVECNLKHAKAVCVLLPNKTETTDEFVEDDMTDRDVSVLKLLMLLNQYVGENTHIVVKADTQTTVDKINQMLSTLQEKNMDHIVTFSYNAVLGHIIGQILKDKLFSDFTKEVLSFDGIEFYPLPNKTVDEALAWNNQCIPVVHYDDDKDGTKDQLYVLAENRKDTSSLRTTPFQCEPSLRYNPKATNQQTTIYLIGEGRKAAAIEEEINNQELLRNRSITVKHFAYTNNIAPLITEMKELPGKKKLLLLSNEDVDEDSIDANIFISLLNFKSSGISSDDVEIITEILDPINTISANSFGSTNLVVSNSFVSLYIAQLLMNNRSKEFFQDIICSNSDKNKGNVDIDITTASMLFDIDAPLVFESKAQLMMDFYLSTNKKCTIIGYVNPNEHDINYLFGQTDAPCKILLAPDTKIIFAHS